MKPNTESTTKKSPIVWVLIMIVLIVVVGLGVTALTKDSEPESATGNSTTNSATPEANANTTEPVETAPTTGAKTYKVSYTNNCYDLSSISINAGDTIVFTNNSSSKMWPASDNHPSHTIYPEFDARKNIDSGDSYEFKFDKTGTWGFHDHIRSSCEGTITVS